MYNQEFPNTNKEKGTKKLNLLVYLNINIQIFLHKWNVCVFFPVLSFLIFLFSIYSHFALLFYFSQSWPLFTLDTHVYSMTTIFTEKIKFPQFLLPFSLLEFFTLLYPLIQFYSFRVSSISNDSHLFFTYPLRLYNHFHPAFSNQQ